MKPAPESVRAYYDNFMKSRMLNYRLEGNLRIQKATRLILEYLRKDTRVLEIGCGIGLATEKIAKKSKRGFVWACDISEKNIWYAKETVKSKNIEFRQIDILSEFNSVKDWVKNKVDLIVMIDVLEHIPLKEHSGLFKSFHEIAGENVHIILTYPSPQYQLYLKRENRQELQIIDEVIEPSHLLKVAHDNGFALKEFRLADVWLRNQYVHCVLSAASSVQPINRPNCHIAEKLFLRVQREIKNRVVIPWRRRKYVDRIFRTP